MVRPEAINPQVPTMLTRAFDGSRPCVPAVLLLVALILIPGCGGDGDGPTDPPTPTISIALSPSSLTLEQWTLPATAGAADPPQLAPTTGDVNVTLTRGGEYTGTVTVSVDSPPTGVSATPITIGSGIGSGTLTIQVSADAALGTSSLTVRATGTGVSDATATLSLEVTPPPGELVSLNFCAASGIPDWVAFRDGSGDWTPVSVVGDGTVFEFYMTETYGSVAIVKEEGGTADVEVFHAARSELGYRGEDYCTGGGIFTSATGSFAGVGPTDIASVSMGGSSAMVIGASGVLTFALDAVRDGPVDLIATLSTLVASGDGFAPVPAKMIIRRDLEPPDAYAIPELDFSVAPAFIPADQSLTINNLMGHKALVSVAYHTTNGGTGSLHTDYQYLPDTDRRYVGVPVARMAAGEFHTIMVNSSATENVAISYRGAILAFQDPTPKTITLGPLMAPMDVGPLSWTGPYVRFFMRIPFQAEYDDYYFATIQQEGGRMNSLSLGATKAYLDGASFDFQTPDFTGVAGWNDDWGLQAGLPETTLVTMTAMGWTGDGGITGMPFSEEALTLYSRFSGRFGGF